LVNLLTVPLLDQPLQLSGTRERKKVQRFTEEFKSEPKDAVVIEIPEGKGIALGDIPRIDAVLQVSIRPMKLLSSVISLVQSTASGMGLFVQCNHDRMSAAYSEKFIMVGIITVS
jgi:hypothetical protein